MKCCLRFSLLDKMLSEVECLIKCCLGLSLLDKMLS